ncbi:hypothetical protein DKX38_020871 [Salix brachista]|uniref:Uncharacterized protein n=1 Tax=Salix brachista TaxID=2182728 RepID=A0A5N5K918_9ROSI|nr:hypothetical protein DKX38_020871 [Salix brachista]
MLYEFWSIYLPFTAYFEGAGIDGILPMSPTLLSHLMFQVWNLCQVIAPNSLLISASESSALKEYLEILIEVSKTADGCADLSSKNLLSVVLQLITQLNLCIKGLTVVQFQIVVSQVLAIVFLAGKEHQQARWGGLFHHVFPMITKVRSRETCDPLCIIIYACCDESPDLVSDKWGSRAAYCNCIFREEWMKLLIFRIRLDEIHFPQLFSKLYYVSNSENGEEVDSSGSPVSTEKEYLLNLLPNISSDPLTLFHGAKLDLLLDRSAMVDLLGYSLPISRDMSHAWFGGFCRYAFVIWTS